jgi:hypothetical protein
MVHSAAFGGVQRLEYPLRRAFLGSVEASRRVFDLKRKLPAKVTKFIA